MLPQIQDSYVTATLSCDLAGRDIKASHRCSLGREDINEAINKSLDAFCQALSGSHWPQLACDGPYIDFTLDLLILDDSPDMISTNISISLGLLVGLDNIDGGVRVICSDLIQKVRARFFESVQDLNIEFD